VFIFIFIIAQACRHVPAEPVRDFFEAIQCFWFVHLAMHIEQYGWSISAGRFDQYMYPFYHQDIESGVLSKEQAWELILNLWVKFMENVGTRIKESTFQNMTLGGQDEDGNDQSNELSSLCIDATIALHIHQPALSVRWHTNISPGFWRQVHQAISEGLGLPALFNDEAIIVFNLVCGNIYTTFSVNKPRSHRDTERAKGIKINKAS
jgi:pyruvate-formate lyase